MSAGKSLEELEAEVALLRSVLDNAPDYITTTTIDGTILRVNRVRLGGRRPEELVGRSLYDFLPASARGRWQACLRSVADTGRPDEIETEVSTLDGRKLWLHTRIGPIVEEGRVRALCLIASDITRLKQIEQALRDSEQKLRLALSASGVGLWSFDVPSRRLTLDESCLRLFGITTADAPADDREALRLIHPDDRAAVERRHAEALRTGVYRAGEARIVRPDGAIRWVFGQAAMVRDPEGRLRQVVGGILDVTERRQLEEKLRQTQKMEAIGVLTAGIAHNFNNLLMVMLPNLERAAAAAPGELAEPLAAALEATRRAAALVGDLTVFAGRGRGGEPRDEDLVAVVRRAVDICRSTFPAEVALTLEVQPDLPPILLDAGQLEQALLNLLINARDAVEGQPAPAVRVTVRRLARTAPEIAERAGAKAVDHLCVEVQDNGVGMTEEVRSRMFEPFFTTKDVGKGTGLGLSTTYAIVNEHRGWIACGSALARGTTMSLYLPIRQGGRRERPAALAAAPAGAGERVLVVDDEPMVRGVVGRLLATAGYDVLLAADAAEALNKLREEPGVRLVLLDDSMPGTPGRVALPQIRTLVPGVKVVLFTGYRPEPDSLPGADGVLEKPVSMEVLLRFVRQALDA